MTLRRGDIDMGGKHGRHTASLLDAALCRLANDWHVADIADKQAAVLAFFRVPSMTHGHAIATAVEENWDLVVSHYAPRDVPGSDWDAKYANFLATYRPRT